MKPNEWIGVIPMSPWTRVAIDDGHCCISLCDEHIGECVARAMLVSAQHFVAVPPAQCHGLCTPMACTRAAGALVEVGDARLHRLQPLLRG